MPIIDSNFDAAKFLYYNPELTVNSNILSNRQAFEWAFSNDTTGMASNDDIIPVNFNSEAFISDFKRNLDASRLNNTIYMAMIQEGFTPADLTRRSKYLATIYQDALLENSNVFRFNYLSTRPEDRFYANERTIAVGDRIKLMHNTTKVYEYARVGSVVDTERIALSNGRKVYDNIGDTYKVIGIQLVDHERLARINYLRGLDPPPSVPNEDGLTYIDTKFNPQLYKLLYPDAKHMSDLQAYYDYIARRDNSEKRIGGVGDIPLDSNIFTPAFDYLDVNYRLTMADDATIRWGDNYVYGISDDAVTRARLLNPAHDLLITEHAIKTYIDKAYDELAVFNNIIVNGTAVFNGIVDFNQDVNVNKNLSVGMDVNVHGVLHARTDAIVYGDLSVSGATVLSGGTSIVGLGTNYIENVEISNGLHTNNSEFRTDVMMQSNLFVNGYSMGPRIGIGPPIAVDIAGGNDSNNGLYDAKLRNVNIHESCDVGTTLPDGQLALRVHGFIHAENLNYVSDSRLKNINGAYSNDGNGTIEQLTPVLFSYKGTSFGGQRERIGFIADEVEKVIPHAINKIASYEAADIQLQANVSSDGSWLLFRDTSTPKFANGDLLNIVGHGWVKVQSGIGQEYKVTSVDDTNSLDRICGASIIIDKMRLSNVRTIDYPTMVAVMWAEMKEMKKHLCRGL